MQLPENDQIINYSYLSKKSPSNRNDFKSRDRDKDMLSFMLLNVHGGKKKTT